MKTQNFPLVEAVDANPWIIRRGSGAVDPEKRIMLVPLGATAGDRHVRAHEMAHVKITPKVHAHKQCKKFGVSNDALQCCEDLRVHSYLRSCGVSDQGVLSQAEADVVLSKNKTDHRFLATFLVSSLFTTDYPKAIAALEKVLSPEVLEDLVSKVHLVNQRLHSGKKIYRPIGLRNCTIPAARLLDAIWSPEEYPDDCNVPLKHVGGSDHQGSKGAKWGNLTTQKLPFNLMKKVSMCGRKKTFCDEGAILSAPYRMPLDGKVFVRKRRVLGGTVLLDASGSMRLSKADLKNILRVAPAATIAIYSGRNKSGTLTVVGEQARLSPLQSIIEARRSSGGGNVVDGPALRWLGTQPEPRIWVSDGIVTGVGDELNIDLAVDAITICRKANIRRIEKADVVASFLRLPKKSR